MHCYFSNFGNLFGNSLGFRQELLFFRKVDAIRVLMQVFSTKYIVDFWTYNKWKEIDQPGFSFHFFIEYPIYIKSPPPQKKKKERKRNKLWCSDNNKRKREQTNNVTKLTVTRASVYNGHLWGPVTRTLERFAVTLSLPVWTT